MTIPLLILLLAIGLVVAMALAWVLAITTGESGWADAAWTAATAGAGVAAALLPVGGEGWNARQFAVAAAIAIWGLRLGSHIAGRSAGADDPRYAALKEEWGDKRNSRLFLFLQIQAAAALVLAVSVLAAARNPAPFGAPDWLALAIVAIAVAGEHVADHQLAAFRTDPSHRGKVCDVGLWSHSRHPNYFFEWLFWMSLPLFAFEAGGSYAFGLAALAAPALIYWLLVHVSGIPPLEAHMLRSRGEAFRDYQKRVNAFWPGPARLAGVTGAGRASR